MPTRRQSHLIILTFLSLLSLFYFYRSSRPLEALIVANGHQRGCQIPRLDPWDVAIKKYIQPFPALICQKTQVDLTYLTRDGQLIINKTERLSIDFEIDCSYRCYWKTDGDDDTPTMGQWMNLENNTTTNCEFLEVKCWRKSHESLVVYSNNHARIIPKSERKIKTKENFVPNVLLFVLDSVSQSNWRRSLPKSFEVINNKYKSYIFNGMTKVGDQSFPNAVAFLAGKKESEFGDLHGFFDDHPLIWKNFKQNNYSTFYAEDYPGFNLFYYLAKGFRHQPVDHYFRPYWLNVYGSYLHRRSTNLCYGNGPLHQLQLDYLSQFISKHSDSPFFALNWLTELGHDYMNQLVVGDEDISKFLDDHHHLLEDSFVFILSDHGHRFDAIRETAIGRLEERLPFFSMHLPKSLKEAYPVIGSVVEGNTQVLTTFWDFYVTLRDILHMSTTQTWYQLGDHNVTTNKEAEKRFRRYSPRGNSLLRRLEKRNCPEAHAPEEYCVCNVETPVDVSDPKIQQGASLVVNHINNLLTAYPQCAQLSINYITTAQSLFPSNNESRDDLLYRITVNVLPSNGLFEALVTGKATSDHMKVIGDVNRINRYGNQSECINNRQDLKKYCFCLSNKV